MLLYSLLPSETYIFETRNTVITTPMTVNHLLNSEYAGEAIIRIAEGDGPVYDEIWSEAKGWNKPAFERLLLTYTKFLNVNDNIEKKFTDSAHYIGLDVIKTIEAWYRNDFIGLKISHVVKDGKDSLKINVDGMSFIEEVIVPMDIKKGEKFSFIYGDVEHVSIWNFDFVTSFYGFY